ncbi:MAG TPA: transporter substrate-binding domain-containing protein, partial [Anaerolineales bacterium]|nr:transporter substrate-binding domain-containing protein [Anaerolineales bacterium]
MAANMRCICLKIPNNAKKGKIMKKNKYLIAIAFLVFVLAACTQPTPAPAPVTPTTSTITAPATTPTPQDDSWLKVQQAGILRVGTSADYPPFEYYNEKSELDGFDIALIQQIGQKLGLKVELNDFAFDGLATVVAIDQVDVAIGALSVTPERQAIANFSNVYYAGSDAVLSRPEADPKNVQNPEALAAARLGVQINSIYETYAQDKLIDAGLMPKQNLYVYTDIAQAVNDLKDKRIDAVWLDLKPAQSFVDAGGMKILVQDMNQQLYAIGMKKGADTLRDKINEALTQLQNDGTLANLQVQYLGVKPDDVVIPPTLTPSPSQPTPAPPSCLNGAEWVADLSYDDKNMKAPPVLNPGQPFTKGWRMRNSGTCTWKSGYMMVYSSGNVPAAQMGGQPIPVTRDVKPNDTFDFQVNLIAPIVPSTYQGFWNVRNAQNQKFGETVWVGITVRGAATPTPAPTQTPAPNIVFTADRTTITAGQAVLFKWTTDNVKAVYFYHDGQTWSDHAVPGNSQSTEYPPYTQNYYLRVVQNNDAVVVRTITINVNPAADAPVIDYLSASPPQITVGQCVSVDWSVSGQVNRVALLVNNSPVWDGAPIRGNYQDCPNAAGTRVYTLQAFGPGGNSTQQTTVNVQMLPPTPVPPTPTAVPTTPVPQPPVIQNFTVAPTSIEQDQCVIAS